MKFLEWLESIIEMLFGSKSPKDKPAPVAGSGGKYTEMYNSMHIRGSWEARAVAKTDLVQKNKDRYADVAAHANVPWFIVGLIHLMESDCNFKTHLHNGDPLTARTRQVPAGRPKAGNPPFEWEFSAIDALNYDGIKNLDTLEKQLAALERYNGLGYKKKGLNSPYLWSGSNHYIKGRYVADGKYDSESVSQQVGAAVVLKILKDRGVA